MKRLLSKKPIEQASIGWHNAGAHGGFLDLKIMLRVEEVVEDENELGELDKKLQGG